MPPTHPNGPPTLPIPSHPIQVPEIEEMDVDMVDDLTIFAHS